MTLPTDSPPRIVSVTAGGAGMFCGSCMRDNTLAAALHRRGVPITLVPTFTPIRTDEADVTEPRVFLGGLNVYLEQKWPWLGRLPRPLRRALDHPRLLDLLSRAALQTRRSEDGLVALSLLRGEAGRQRAEIRDLVDWIVGLEPPIVNVTNLLVAGFVPALKARRSVPVVVTLQGDDLFLDALEPEQRGLVLAEMRRLARHVDAFVVFTEDYRRRMAELFEIPLERLHRVPLGMAGPEAFHPEESHPEEPSPPPPIPPTPPTPPTVGYLARISPEKGFHVLVDAFLRLRTLPGTEATRLRFGGWLGAVDQTFFERQMDKIRAAGAQSAAERVDLPDRESKIRFLRGLDVFSVPAVYREPKGLYLLEALAAGVPVVQPDHGSFPEILAATGGGSLVPPDDPEALARGLHALLITPAERRRLGREGREGVLAHHTDAEMARATLEVWQRLVHSPSQP